MFTVKYNEKRTRFVGKYGEHYSGIFSKNQFYEMDLLQYIQSLSINGVYVDIGGNVGNHSLFFAQHCGAVKVYVFEPLKRYQAYIEANVRANGLENVIKLFPFGLSNSNETVSFKMGEREEFIDSPRTLDGMDLPESSIALIKIDVEGLEFKVLEGSAKTIERFRPRIFCEVLDIGKRDSIDKLLAPIGYHRNDRVFNASPTYEWYVLPD